MERPLLATSHSLSAIASLLGTTSPETDLEITGVSNNSSLVEPGDIFLAYPGAKVHGATFTKDAMRKGALAVITDLEGAKLSTELPTIVVRNPRKTAGDLSAWFYSEPMRDIYSVGITGTNGKTTTTTLLHQIWMNSGSESGLIGTVGTRIGDEALSSTRTTPESCEIQSLIAVMRERHLRNVAMEISSHALSLDRIQGSHFNIVGFTNLTQDHLDFHGDMETYYLVKKKLFSFEFADLAVINIDSEYGARLANEIDIPFLSVSRDATSADWHYESIVATKSGTDVSIRGIGGILIEGTLPLHGDYNLDNALMAIAIAIQSGVNPVEISSLLSQLTGAQGRLERIDVGQDFLTFVDYAHTPDAVRRVLETCRAMTQGKVIGVLGCGGDRDPSKRPLMGTALVEGSDIAIFTSDNPRSENPETILLQMVGTLKIAPPHTVISDRRDAISQAIDFASGGDVVVVMGKGHETGQEISGVVLPFDDRLILASAIEGKA